MKHLHHKKFIFQYLLFSIFLASIFLIGLNSYQPFEKLQPLKQKPQPATSSQPIDHSTDGQVAGYRYQPDSLFISGGRDTSAAGGVISIPASDEPIVKIGTYSSYGVDNQIDTQIDIFQADLNLILKYLIYDQERQQINPQPDTGSLNKIGSIESTITTGWGNHSEVRLPLSNSGIWLLEIKYQNKIEYGFVIRSPIGSVLKEGNNQFVLWSQQFSDGNHLSTGQVKTYNLENDISLLDESSIGPDGSSKLQYTEQADIAVIQRGSDIALIPVNLERLNLSYSYNRFPEPETNIKYFTFIDRPIYKPGDTIYFKSILREDDDARYSLPTGSAHVTITQGSYQTPLLSTNLPVSSDGTVYGQYQIPEDVKTGSYSLKIDINGTTDSDYWNDIYFQITHYRKPEYTLDISSPEMTYISGDKAKFNISGQYFSGQPLAGQTVNYQIFRNSYYEYYYYSDHISRLQDDYRYGYWSGKPVIRGQVTLSDQGQAVVEIDTKLTNTIKQSQIFSLQADYQDISGNPVTARKNILVRRGEWGIYRTNYQYGGQIGQPIDLNLKLVNYRQADTSGRELTAEIVRETWTSHQEPNKKYPTYKKQTQKLPDLKQTTDKQGQATFPFTPQQTGSYQFTIKSRDDQGNLIRTQFPIWVTDQKSYYYTDKSQSSISIRSDQEKYQPGDTAYLTISSQMPDRDIWLSMERGRQDRYQLVEMTGNSVQVPVKLLDSDMPNIYAKINGFSHWALETDQINLPVSALGQKMDIDIKPDQTTYSPGAQATVNLHTTDQSGNPLSGDLTMWVVDKAIFELAATNLGDIWEKFWKQRYHSTRDAHSLEGIIAYTAEGGGCFSGETEILMSNGQTTPINQVQIGDQVLTRQSASNAKLVPAEVVQVYKYQAQKYLIINDQIKVTPLHPFWVNDHSWKRAGSLQVGDHLLNAQAEFVPVKNIEWVDSPLQVYNLQVADHQTYFAEHIWVHNKGGGFGDREIFADTAYWNPDITTNAQGRAQVSFQLPDNLTTWVIAAVGATPQTIVGQNTQEIVVTQPVIIRPALPNILQINDQLNISANIHNFSNQDQVFDINLDFDSGTVQNATRNGIMIPAQKNIQLSWPIKPLTENETAKLHFSAQSQENTTASDSLISTIPVQKFGFWNQHAQVGEGPQEFTIDLAPDSDLQKTQIDFTLSSTLTGNLPEAMKYLVQYPYGCVEQTTSRFVPAVIAQENPDLFSDSIDGQKLDEIVQAGITRLKELEKTRGGWSWWSSGYSNHFITTYVIEYLLKAQTLGYSVDQDVLTRAESLLSSNEYYDPSNGNNLKYDQDQYIAATYGLTLLKSEQADRKLTNLDQVDDDILALAVMANVNNGITDPQENGLNLLISRVQRQGEQAWWQSGDQIRFGSQDASTALALRAIVSAQGPQNLATQAVRYLTRSRQSQYWSNTFATAQVVQALVEYSDYIQENSQNYQYQILLDQNIIQSGTLNNIVDNLELNIAPSQINNSGSQLSLQQTGQGPLYSTLVVNEWRTDPSASHVEQGISINRTYQVSGRPENVISVGDEVTVKLKVSGLKISSMYAVIEDQLPSGLIPVNPRLNNEHYGSRGYRSYYRNYGVSDREVTENGIIMSLYRIDSGEQTYTYQARAIASGNFLVPPANISLMYSPEIYGRSQSQNLKIYSDQEVIPTIIPTPTVQPQTKSELPDPTTILSVSLATLFLSVIGMVIIKKKFL